MTSFTFDIQRSVYWTSVTSCFVLLAALCCCNGVPHQRTVKMANPLQNASESSTMPDTTKQPEAIMVDLGALLDAGDGAVATLVAGDTRVAAHRAVLAAGSPALAAMFIPDTLNGSSSEVNIPAMEGPVLRQMVAFLYTGRAPQLPGMAFQLLEAAQIYGMSTLKDFSEQQVAEQLSVENAADTAVLAQRYRLHTLREAVVAFIKGHLEVLATKGWAEAVLNHPADILQITHLLKEPSTKASATTITDSTLISTAATTATPATTDSMYISTATTPATPVGCNYIQRLNATAVSLLRSLSTEEKVYKLGKAAYDGSVQEVRALLAAGVDVGVRDEDGWTPLHWAAEGGNMEAAQCLLQAGAVVDARGSEWQHTPLHRAAGRGHTAVVRLLLAANADPNAKSVTGKTPLHRAAMDGRAEAAAALLKAGADRGATNNWGETALDVARVFDRQDVIQILQGNFSSNK